MTKESHMMKSRPNVALTILVVLIYLVLPTPVISHGEPVAVAAIHADTLPGLKGAEKESLIVTSKYYIGPEDVLDINVWRQGPVEGRDGATRWTNIASAHRRCSGQWAVARRVDGRH